jgi:hypothetical protein
MSCIPLAPAHVAVLTAVADRQPPPPEHADALAELQSWAWVMASGELTGTGWEHARKPGKGVLEG